MALRLTRLDCVSSVPYAFEPPIAARLTDVGRALGSQAIGFAIQTVAPGCWSSRRHRHLFQEEILIVMTGTGLLHHGDARLPVSAGAVALYRPDDPEPHAFENTGSDDLVIWAFGNRFAHEVCLYPDQGVAFVEGLGADVPLAAARPSEWTEDRRPRSTPQDEGATVGDTP